MPAWCKKVSLAASASCQRAISWSNCGRLPSSQACSSSSNAPSSASSSSRYLSRKWSSIGWGTCPPLSTAHPLWARLPDITAGRKSVPLEVVRPLIWGGAIACKGGAGRAERTEVAVVGAGLLGLAAARSLASVATRWSSSSPPRQAMIGPDRRDRPDLPARLHRPPLRRIGGGHTPVVARARGGERYDVAPPVRPDHLR